MAKIKKFLTYNNCLFGYVLLFIFFVVFNFFLYKNIDLLLNSDISSELVLAEIMNKEKTVFTKSWYYSTELRVFNTQWIFAPLFSFIKNNYHLIRIIGCSVLQLLLLLSFYYLCKQLEIKYFPYLAIFLIGAYCDDYFCFFLEAPHYIPYLIVAFLSLAFIIQIYKSDKPFIKYRNEILLCVIAFLSCLNSKRQLAITYLPIFCSFIVLLIAIKIFKKNNHYQNKKSIIVFITIMFAISLVGYFIGTSEEIINSFEMVRSDEIKISLASFYKITNIAYFWAKNYGYLDTFGLVYKIISGIIAVILFFYSLFASIIIIIKENKDLSKIFIAIFYLVSSAIMACVFLFTTMSIEGRYITITTLMCFVIIGIYMNSEYYNSKFIYIFLLLYTFTIANTFILLKKEINKSENHDLINIKNILMENNIKNGYATFWNANILTELSDGYIEVWQYDKDYDSGVITASYIVNLENGKWLQNKKHFYNYPEGKVFLLFNKMNDTDINMSLLSDFLIYESDLKQLFIFNNFDEMKENLYRATN